MCIFNIHIVDTDVEYYDGRHQHKILSQHERHQKGKYIGAFLERQHQYMLLMLSVEGVIGEDKNAVTNQLAASLSTKYDREYLATCRYFQDFLSLNLVHALILMAWGAWGGNP